MPEATTSNNKTNARRKALTILGGGLIGATQLPAAWTRPVINSIVLPAHAQTTTPEIQSQPDDTPAPAPEPQLPTHFRDIISFVEPIRNGQGSSTPNASDLLSLLVSEAHAGYIGTDAGDLSIDSVDGINFTAKLNYTQPGPGTIYSFVASGQINGGPAPLRTTAACGSNDLGDTISVTAISDAGAAYSLDLNSFFVISNGVLPVASGDPATSSECIPL